jgi:hypothetical protein
MFSVRLFYGSGSAFGGRPEAGPALGIFASAKYAADALRGIAPAAADARLQFLKQAMLRKALMAQYGNAANSAPAVSRLSSQP